MIKQEALQNFVKNNYRLLKDLEFDKNIYKDLKKEYFGKKLKYQFGNPTDKEICDIFIEIMVKNEKLFDQVTLQKAIEEHPFLKMNNIIPDQYLALINSTSKKFAIQDGVDQLKGLEKIEKELEWVKKERAEEIEEHITKKKEEYLRLPSILDDTDFKEPEQVSIPKRETEWWSDINLKDNPFPGDLDGFSRIDKSLYQQIIVETEPIRWALKELDRQSMDIFHKGFLLAGGFGTGKTTFYDYMAPRFAMKQIEPIRIALTDCINEAQYVQKFEKEVSIEVTKLVRRYELNRTGPLTDFTEARLHMIEIQKNINGFLIFIDDLHKHADLNLVFRFLSHLQITKNNLSRDGINVVFVVAGLPSWKDQIKKDSSLTGFFDAPDQLVLREVTPELAALAIKRRLQAFAINPEKEIDVKQEFLHSVFKKTEVQIGAVNIGFRPYIHEAVQRFEQRQFNILSADITMVDPKISQEIKTMLEENQDFANRMQKLVFGGGIQKPSTRDMTLRILCEIYLRKGVTETEEFFNNQKYCFQRLEESGFIQKFDRQIGGQHNLIWNINPSFRELNKKIITRFQLSMEDYLVPIYSTSPQKTIRKKELNKLQIYEQDLKQWEKHLDHNMVISLNKSISDYTVNIYSYLDNKFASIEDLPTIDKIKESLWTMMKSLIKYESPLLLDICGEDDIDGWSLRHRSLQCLDQFISLLHSAKGVNITATDITRLISFADEAFVELWGEFKESINFRRNTAVTCYMLPKNILKSIYAEYSTLLSMEVQNQEYFNSLDRFIADIEQSIRQYLLVCCTLVFGPYHKRIKYYPDEIKKYITKKQPSASSSYEAYNEFENLNRGQYRSMFSDSGKATAFFRYIVKPITSRWSNEDISAFFEIFGDLNIITSHKKTNSSKETKRDIPTFLRLSCRLIADMSIRLKSIITIDNIIYNSGITTNILFGQQAREGSSTDREVKDASAYLAQGIHQHDITEVLQSYPLQDMLNTTYAKFGFTELNMLEIEETRINFGRSYSEIVSSIAYYLAKNKLQAIPLYGPCIWLKEI